VAFEQQRPGGAAQGSPSPIHTAALHQQTHIAIDCSNEDDLQFWGSMMAEEAFHLGKRLINLTALTLVQPFLDQSWCLNTMIYVVEAMRSGDARRARRRGSGSWRRAVWRPSNSPLPPTNYPSQGPLSLPPSPSPRPSMPSGPYLVPSDSTVSLPTGADACLHSRVWSCGGVMPTTWAD